MNVYRSKSETYQVFVTSEMMSININAIVIPKLNLHLLYNNEDKYYKKGTQYNRSKHDINKIIEDRKKKDLKPLYYEINHFKLEDGLIDLLISKDVLNNKLGSEILMLKLNDIKL